MSSNSRQQYLTQSTVPSPPCSNATPPRSVSFRRKRLTTDARTSIWEIMRSSERSYFALARMKASTDILGDWKLSCDVMMFGSCPIRWLLLLHALIQIQSPDETNVWQQSHHMIDSAFRHVLCCCLHLLSSSQGARKYNKHNNDNNSTNTNNDNINHNNNRDNNNTMHDR